MNPGPLQDQQVLLTPEPSLQTLEYINGIKCDLPRLRKPTCFKPYHREEEKEEEGEEEEEEIEVEEEKEEEEENTMKV